MAINVYFVIYTYIDGTRNIKGNRDRIVIFSKACAPSALWVCRCGGSRARGGGGERERDGKLPLYTCRCAYHEVTKGPATLQDSRVELRPS